MTAVDLALAWPWTCLALALAWPWAVPKVLGLGLMTCGLINITRTLHFTVEMCGLR